MAGEDATRLALDLVKQSLYAYFRCLSRSRAAICLDSKGIYRWRTSVPHAWLNGVLCSAPAGVDSAHMVDDVMEDSRVHNVSTFSWWFAKDGLAEGWLDILRRRGFRTERSTPGMAVPLDRLPPRRQLPGLTIMEAADGPCMRDWAKTIVAGFGLPERWADPILALHGDLAQLPNLRHYVGYRDGEPIGISCLLVAAGVASLQYLAVVPGARNGGAGAALALAALTKGREMGYRLGVLQSTEMGYPLYLSLGFRMYGTVDYYCWSR